MRKGAIHSILNKTYEQVCKGYLDDVRKRIINMQISIKTGLNLNTCTKDTEDSEEDIKKVLEVIRGPEIGLKDFEYDL
jgi:hypothetical protein